MHRHHLQRKADHSPMKHIWLIRHGQSMSQIDATVSGPNSPLSPLGEQQARAVNENTAVSKLVITEESVRQLEYWNDHGHVLGLETTP